MSDRALVRLKELRRKASENRARAEGEAAAFKKDEEALDRTLELLGESEVESDVNGTTVEPLEFPTTTREEEPPSSGKIDRPSANGHSRRIRITQEIRKAVQEFEGEFTQHDVVEWIKEKHPLAEVRSATVSSALWRMGRQEVIEKVREGFGSEPHTYQKVSGDGSAQEGFPDEERTSDEEDAVSKEDSMSE